MYDLVQSTKVQAEWVWQSNGQQEVRSRGESEFSGDKVTSEEVGQAKGARKENIEVDKMVCLLVVTMGCGLLKSSA